MNVITKSFNFVLNIVKFTKISVIILSNSNEKSKGKNNESVYFMDLFNALSIN